MIFGRHATSRNYFLPIDEHANLKCFVFSENNIGEFSLSDALDGKYPENYLLVFYKGKIDFGAVVDEALRGKVRASTRIYWLDDFTTASIGAASYIYLDKKIIKGFSSFGIGSRAPNIQIVNRAIQGTISLNPTKTALVLKPDAGKFYELAAHGSTSNIDSISISLSDAAAKAGKHVFQNENSLGSVNFRVLQKGALNQIQPVSPYFLNKENSATERTVQVFYFDKESFNQNTELYISLKPFKQVSNKEDGFSSYMETVFKKNVLTNFSDEKGRQFRVEGGVLLGRIAPIQVDAGDPYSKRFFFIPQEGQELLLFPDKEDAKQLFAGFNGTEAFGLKTPAKGTSLLFREMEIVSINKVNGALEKNGDSKTAFIELGKGTYSLDSEKSPIFLNNKLESGYEFIKKGDIAVPVALPLIPTFSFRDNADLKELEEVFKKIRIKNISSKQKEKKLLPTNRYFVTPQGFLKQGTSYDFIKNETKSQSGKKTLGSFQFNLVDKGGKEDLDLSLRKDEVFFVLTPGLFKRYKDAVLNARFAINKSSIPEDLFNIDLTSVFQKAVEGEHDNSIIIFKFHKKPVADLLKDVTQWSNNGSLLGNQTSLNAIVQQIEEKELLNVDDTYFKNSILKDANWNGVLILNIPIGSAENLPGIFTGLSNSQRLNKNEKNEKLALNTELNFKYAAFPVNKTAISGSSVSISSTSFYGLIDYNPFADKNDYELISDYFDNKDWKFVLSKLKVQFANSKIAFFESFAFLQVHQLFEDTVDFEPLELSHGKDGKTDKKPNLIRLNGSYQKNSDDSGQFLFDATLKGNIKFGEEAILEAIQVGKVGFSYNSATDDFRFDIDASAVLGNWKGAVQEFVSVKRIDFSNIGLKFKLAGVALPSIKFDLSNLFVLPEIDFDCKGLLSSFPIKFSHFNGYKIKRINGSKIDINYDFFTLPKFKVPKLNDGDVASLFSFVFDFDLGTLGDLAALKALKGQLLVGWSIKGGFVLGLRLNGPSTDGLHVDLFGALKLDIQKVDLCKFNEQFMLRLTNARLSVLGLELPPKEDVFSGLIFAGKGSKVAWLISYVSGNDPDVTKNKLTLGVGQRVGLPDLSGIRDVGKAIEVLKEIFDPKLDACKEQKFPDKIYAPENNWLVASENLIPEQWKDIIDLKFIFNDPVLYGVFLRVVGLFDVDILYKKVSDNLGVWALELALDPSIRNIEMGAASVTLPNIGIEMYTNGDWRGDIGYPRSTSDWSRSCLIQIRPFVGWAGFYIARLRTASLSLFAQYLHLLPKKDPHSEPGSGVEIIQAGFAFRIGIGAYIDKGIFYVGASISVYGILEGAFAFNKGQGGLKKLFPDHFALRGRVGAIAELIGYVDFKIIKAAVYIILRVEFGFLLALINGKLQPVPIYIEGEVSVRVSVTIACFRIFRKRICIVIHLSFRASVRFPYTLGGGSKKLLEEQKDMVQLLKGPIRINFGEIPIIYIPSVTKTSEKNNQLIHHFAVQFFGCRFEGEKLEFSAKNVFKDFIIRPIFEAVINTGFTTYSQLRSLFLEGANHIDTQFEITSLTPVLYTGFSDLSDFDFLKKFGFNEAEAASFKSLLDKEKCGTDTDQCPFRIIPIPITSSIKVVSKEGVSFESDAKGFTINLDGLFKNAAGNPVSITAAIKREELYSDAEIELIEKHFDEYMTQFIERKKAKSKVLKGLKDLREDAILKEYIKLIGLLTLEAYFNFLSGHEENRDKPDYNPEVKLSELFADTGDWVLNDHLEAIIGQLNYFYNNGLRLPDPKQKLSTKAYYEALKQNSPIGSVNTAAVLADVDVVFAKHDGSTPISLKEDMFQGDGLREFVESAERHLAIDFEKVAKEFKGIAVEKPYSLMDVKLPVSNSILNIVDEPVKLRFFEVPKKIAQYFKREKASLILHAVSNNDNADKEVIFTPCINIEAKVKPHLVGNRTKVVEFINVYAHDLHLMHQVKEAKENYKKVNVYVKETKNGAISLYPLIAVGGETQTKIVRANLSPRTHPPVIIEQSYRAKAEDKYVASLSEQLDFTSILWEALTTNNGGYFLVESPDSDLFNRRMPVVQGDKKQLEYSLVFSFESMEDQPFSAMHNYLKVADESSLFQKLDRSESSLYVDVRKVVTKKGKQGALAFKPVQEYHTKIPVHCFGFSIEREEPNTSLGHDQYLPVEFEIVGSADITREKVLPLMPLEKKDEGTNEIIPGKLFYSHLTPLQKVSSVANKERYRDIGKTFKLKFGVRDTYGFKAFDLKDELSYRHVYFDKLVPLTSWPFLDCSFWFKEFKSNELVFTLRVKAFYKDQIIPTDDKEKIRESLYTVIAQLTDPKVMVKLNYTSSADLKAVFLDCLEHVLKNLDAPKVKERVLEFKVKADANFKMLLQPVVTINRPNDASLYVDVEDSVWDVATIREVVASVPLDNPNATNVRVSNSNKVRKTDNVGQLNNLLRTTSGCPYTVGLGSDEEGEKDIFLIRRDYLQSIQPVQKSPLPKSQYFAIKPYSNQLYSGKYTPVTQGASQQTFTNFDLDKGLRVILSKIDNLLSPTSVTTLNSTDSKGELYLQKLVAAKKELVVSELQNKTDNIDVEITDKQQAGLRKEFRDLLLNKVENFYYYDGIISLDTNVSAPILQQFKEHRFTVNSAKDEKGLKYNMEMSKLVFREGQAKWVILFDQIEYAPNIELELDPQITHIEFDIEPMGPEIEKSNWIQLVEPVPLSFSINTLHIVEKEKWPTILRVFPPKPQILEHKAEQLPRSGNLTWESKTDLGKWQYVLMLEDSYESNDQLDITINIRDNGRKRLVEGRNFKGFIAYWSAKLIDGSAVDTELIDDLAYQMSLAEPNAKAANISGMTHKFKLNKQAGGWSKSTEGIPFTVEVRQEPEKLTLVLSGEGFDVFQGGNRIIAVSPEIKALRNRRAENDDFVYVTDTIAPATWAIPHIKFHTPIKLAKGLDLQTVYNKMSAMSLPYKSTAKFLLNTSDLDKSRQENVPLVPLLQMEFGEKAKPAISPVDQLFDGVYKNGYPAVSITVYNNETNDNDLPVFSADTIYKDLATKKTTPKSKK